MALVLQRPPEVYSRENESAVRSDIERAVSDLQSLMDQVRGFREVSSSRAALRYQMLAGVNSVTRYG